MADQTNTSVEDLPDEDLRELLHDRVAELLSELSAATDAPKGVETCAQFAAIDVDFECDAWMSRLADVQGWLQFSDDLPDSNPLMFTQSLVLALGFEPKLGAETVNGSPRLTEVSLEALVERADLAARLQQNFLADLDSEVGTQESASASWAEAWSVEEENPAQAQSTPEPIVAVADSWSIYQLTNSKLNLTPSYQRGDVWRTIDRQALIESIIRGIPLPSIILRRSGATTPLDVVDGKQRLTAILRFVGLHPVALETVAKAAKEHPEANFHDLFRTDYPKFRKSWKAFMGETLTAKVEDEYYFPFKLRNNANGGLVGPDLESLRGRYFTEIRENVIPVADEGVTAGDLFCGAPAYKVPVILYRKATQKQIHEVFKLYNKQGMHLNAEEIRNAVYHDVELTRAILVAAGDASALNSVVEVAPSLAGVSGIEELGKTLADYGFGEARYRRTKVLGWIVSVLVNDTGSNLLSSTARHIDLLLSQVQEDESHTLRDGARIADLISLVARAVDSHAAHDELWPDKFHGDGKSSKWQDLPLVASLVGITIAAAGAPSDIEDRIEASAEVIRSAALSEWQRPTKTQTRTQWDFIARVAQGIVEKLHVDIVVASENIRERFGSSGVESLIRSRIEPKFQER